ncbi:MULTISPECIES: DNA topoisomerase IV subunit A [Clostridium]|uniref:DNA topoisomerase IV subunit A n=1 Tax=Clostridium TaxID=1485 RepID=UPI00069EAB01|nr:MULTISPECIES: DNA topoisomerase IV subunit A [Clostridium]KOF56421.1 DNA topoisomerase IV subunit A [Clostridium sp. DMHC 10]MCD2345761.1 DNA topoisomerase IV subunit A [Clostridium guangxiense]
MAKKINIPKDNNIVRIPIEEAMPENYLPYAVEVAKERALPDVRDGLKPVHRRILYGAYMLKAFPDKPYYKSARIVGDILGKYHPHGDSSVYEAMVILAQNFTTRHPLIDGHGNWGSIDGDSAAAMRYTEARLTPIALEMLKDIDKGVVNMVDNYSGSELEPEVLPGGYPNLLVNGTFGIAVGLSTNIPPHNLNETIDASLAYIDNNDITIKELMNYIKGPDLPTGGILIGKNSLRAAYETGEGRVTLRAKTKVEKLENGRFAIVITEFPYKRNKAKLLQTISEMTADKKHSKVLESISDIRDESDRNGIRGVIELKKSADEKTADKILKYLFKKTELQCNIIFNMVAIADGKPETMSLKTILMHYVNHRKDVVTRRTQKELEIAQKRFHIVEGFIKAIGIMDDIIKTIRASKSKKDSEENLVKEFGFTEDQAQAIVELMLYRLTGLEIKTFEKEYKELEKIIKKLNNILKNEKELFKVIKKELIDIKNKYGEERRTEIIENDDVARIDVEEFAVIEDIVVTMSNEGYIKRVSQKAYSRSNANTSDIEYREGDFNKYLFESNTVHNILFFTDNGNMYKIKGDSIPECKWKEKGEKLDNIIKGLDLNKEKVINIFSIQDMQEDKNFIMFTDKGGIKKTGIDKFLTNYSKIMALKLRKDEKLVKVIFDEDERKEKYIEITTELGLSFKLEEPSIEEADRNVMSYTMFNLSSKDRVVNINFIENSECKAFEVKISSKGIIKTNLIKNSKSAIITSTTEKILIFTNKGAVIRVPAFIIENISKEGISISTICDEFTEDSKVVGIISVKKFDEGKYIYFFSKNGFVKKTALSEFDGDYLTTPCYKFRNESDELINAELGEETESDIILVTEKSMCIRFQNNSVNPMGRIASGVTGISLNEDDFVKYGFILKKEFIKMSIKSKLGEEKEILFENIKEQNRGGKGKSLMVDALSTMKIE